MADVAQNKYIEELKSTEQIPLYANPWWLDATCGEKGWNVLTWNTATAKESAFMPYHQTRIRGLKAIVTPPLTQFLPVLHTGAQEEFLFDQLLDQLPSFSILDISLRSVNAGAGKEIFPHVQVRYSYVINALQQMEQVRSKYNEGLRRNLREAEMKFMISESEDVDAFMHLCMMTYHQRKMKTPPWVNTVIPTLFKSLRNNNAGMIKFAIQHGKPVAGILVGWDHAMSYYLTGGRIATESGASAHALLLDHAIQDANSRNLMFDFEGSMHPGIANFFQSFGGLPERFWRIRKFRGLGKIWAMLQS